MNTLIFEGAGWHGAECSVESGVGNCRIRTRIRNNKNRVIYLELGGFNKAWNGVYQGRVDHCFYDDSTWESNKNYSPALKHVQHMDFEYTPFGILQLVNKELDCDFTEIIVVNDDERYYVHKTKEPLCSCVKPEYSTHEYKDKSFNISLLSTVKQMRKSRDGVGDYQLPYRFVKKTMKWWFAEQPEERIEKLKSQTYYIRLRWNNDGKIHSADISANTSDFPCFGVSLDTLEAAINELTKDELNVCKG